MARSHQDETWLDTCLGRLPRARVAVFGDFCVDAYWHVEPDESELSIETGLPVRRVRRQQYSLGGAGNIVANLAALGVGKIQALGLVGRDLFGGEMRTMLEELHVRTEGMLVDAQWQTLVYAKPYVGERELNRLDFGAFSVASDAAVDALARELDRVAAAVDVVVLNQQVPAGLSAAGMIDRINGVIAAHPECRFIVDSRHRAELYRGAILKLNAHEAARLAGGPRAVSERISAADARGFASRLARETAQPVILTRGENGMLVADRSAVHDVPAIPAGPPIDPVGAGDTVVAAIAAALASGSDLLTAVRLASIAASVTVRKLRTTGTATPDEIRRAAESGGGGA